MSGIAQSIMSLFTPQGGARIETPTQTMPNNPTQVQQPGNPLPGSNPANPSSPQLEQKPADTTPVNPLDVYKDLWNAPQGAKPPESIADMFKNLDVKKLNESAQGVDFKGVATPDQLAKIQAGGAEAMNTMLDVMNAMAQRAYAQSTLAGVRVTEQALTRADSIMSNRLPGLVRSAAADDALRGVDESFSHPALQPVVGALKTQFQLKSPNATAGEIQAQVVEALRAMGSVLNPQKTDASNNAGKSTEQDWSKFLEE